MSKEEVIALVRQYAEVEEPREIIIEVLEGVRPDGPFWRVPVRTSYNLPKRYPYYEKLADIETRLHDENKVDVLLVPS